MSTAQHLLNVWLRWTEKPHLRRSKSPDKLRRGFEQKARLFFYPPPGIAQHWSNSGETRVLRLKAQEAGPTVLYLHGGGYIFGSPCTHSAMLARLLSYTGGEAILPEYPKAPEAPFPQALNIVFRIYCEIAKDGPVMLGGDSAGGGLALALLAEIGKANVPAPAGVFVFSPLTDLTFSSDSARDNASRDVVLPVERASEMAQMYHGQTDPRDPRISPLFADFAAKPPVWMCAGTTEILLDDTRRIAARMRDQGVPVTERIETDLPHVWPLFHNTLPEARTTLRDLAGWISRLSPSADGS